MATVQQFEKLEIWQNARLLSVKIYDHFGQIKDYGFKDQICRASISVMNNIAEGFERNSYKEFKHFLQIAKGSAGEVRSMLWIANDLNYIEREKSQQLIEEHIVLSSQLSRFIQYLQKSINEH
jgi:four helix bundle protein